MDIYGMWKQRITMFLKYRECEVVTTRVKTETDSEDWDKKDPKAINIIYSATQTDHWNISLLGI